ncbi:hypothetical protein [Rubrivirga sp.]|uniref:hypothetical protein n=1 Tax=Rubrivirga sp. TaxID=1885344 RepID=UPI003B52A20E
MSTTALPVASALYSGAPISVRTGRNTVVSVRTGLYGTVRIWAPDVSDLPDVFVLVGEDAAGGEVYRSEKPVSAATQTLRQLKRSPSADTAASETDGEGETAGTSGGLWDLAFPVPPGEEAVLQGSGDVRFRLLHRPGQTERGEREVASGMAFSHVFVYGGADGLAPLGLDGKHVAGFVATRFFHGDRLAFPDVEGAERGFTLRQPSVLADAPDPLRAPSTEAAHPVLSREHVWSLGMSSPSYDPNEAAAASQGAGILPTEAVVEPSEGPSAATGSPEELPPTLADRTLWVALLAGTYDAPAEDAEEPDVEPQRLGVWEVGTDGTYRFASYPESGGEAAAETVSYARPEAHGPATRFVLLDTSVVAKSRGRAAYAHTFYGGLPAACLDRSAATLAGDPLVRVAFGSEGDLYQKAASSARWDGSAHCWKVYLPDAVRLTSRMSGLAREAVAHHERWWEASSAARFSAGLTAAACYRPEHRRTYLEEALYAKTEVTPTYHPQSYGIRVSPTRDPAYNMERAWDGFDAEVAGRPLADAGFEHGDTLVWHAAYGLRQQEAYLTHRARVAGRRLEAWLDRPLLADLVRNAAVARALGETAWAEEIGGVVAEGLGSMCSAGAGGALAYKLYQAAGVLGTAQGLAIEQAEQITDPLEEARAWEWSQFLDAPAFKNLWTVVTKGSDGAKAILESLGPVLRVVRSSATRTRRVSLTGKEAAALAAVFEWKLSKAHDSGQVQIFRTDGQMPNRVTMGGTTVTEVGTDIVGIRTQRRMRGNRQVRWRLDYTRTTTITGRTTVEVDVWAPARTAAGRVGVLISALDVVINAESVARAMSEGKLGIGEAVAAGQAIVGAAGVYESVGRGRLLSVAKALGRAAPFLEGATATVGVAQGINDTDVSGVQDEADVDEAMITSALISGAGGAMLMVGSAGGSAAMGVAAAPAVVIGLGLIGVGLAVGWIADWFETQERKDADPLFAWLPAGSVWGERYTNAVRREELMALARPGWDGRAATVMAGPVLTETETFVKTAFTFPVTVRPRLDRGQVTGLTFQIDPHFVPTAGTLALSASVQAQSAAGTNVGRPVSVRCALHYVRADRGFRYRAVTEGDSLPLANDGDLLAQARRERWAPSREAEVTVRHPDGTTRQAEHAVLSVHVGTGVRLLPPDLVDPLLGPAGRAMGRGSLVGTVLHSAAAGNAREDLEERGLVWPSSVAAAEGDLGAALAGGRFEVTGFAAFDPSHPFDPDAKIPETQPTMDDLVRVEDFLYRYPEDA